MNFLLECLFNMLTFKSFLLLEYNREIQKKSLESNPKWPDRIKEDPQFSLEKLESADPTPNKQYVQRLSIWWLGGEPIEDLISTTADALTKYHTLKIKKKIKSEHADINKFKTADQFFDVVAQYQLPDEQQPQDRGKYKEIYRDADLLVVQLLDETAARFWGQKTKWCTAAKNNNMFTEYSMRGPVYVIIPRKDPVNKYQFWWHKNRIYEMQFMDVQDNAVNPQDLSIFGKLQQIFEPLHNHILWKNDPSEHLVAVKQNGMAIQYIKNPIEEVQLAAVKQNGNAIEYIENPSEAVQLAAVKQDGFSIYYIENPSEAVQLAAVKQKLSSAFQYIKKSDK